MYVCLDQGFYEYHPDAQVRENAERAIEKSYNPDRKSWMWNAVGEMYAMYSDEAGDHNHKAIEEIARTSFQKSGNAYIKYLFRTILEWQDKQFYGYGAPPTLVDNLRIGHVLILSVLQGVAVLVLWIRRRYPPWIHIGLFAFTFPMAWLAFVVINDEFMRVMLSTVPPVMISIALFTQWFLNQCGCSQIHILTRDKTLNKSSQ